jgi:hypothetical protein
MEDEVFASFTGRNRGFSDVSLYCFVDGYHVFGENCCLLHEATVI